MGSADDVVWGGVQKLKLSQARVAAEFAYSPRDLTGFLGRTRGIGGAFTDAVPSLPPYDLLERLRGFALAVRAFCGRLPGTDETQEAAGQLRRAANSARNNYRAGRKARSRKLFVDKLGLAREEADECLDWLEYLRDAGLGHDAALLDEASQMVAILTAALKTARRNDARANRPRRHF